MVNLVEVMEFQKIREELDNLLDEGRTETVFIRIAELLREGVQNDFFLQYVADVLEQKTKQKRGRPKKRRTKNLLEIGEEYHVMMNDMNSYKCNSNIQVKQFLADKYGQSEGTIRNTIDQYDAEWKEIDDEQRQARQDCFDEIRRLEEANAGLSDSD